MDIPALYHSVILQIGDGTGLPDAILHINAGMIIFIIVQVANGRSLGTFIPLAFVAAAELGNETLDYLQYGWRWADTLSDIANTLLWPLIISLVVKLRPIATEDHAN